MPPDSAKHPSLTQLVLGHQEGLPKDLLGLSTFPQCLEIWTDRDSPICPAPLVMVRKLERDTQLSSPNPTVPRLFHSELWSQELFRSLLPP